MSADSIFHSAVLKQWLIFWTLRPSLRNDCLMIFESFSICFSNSLQLVSNLVQVCRQREKLCCRMSKEMKKVAGVTPKGYSAEYVGSTWYLKYRQLVIYTDKTQTHKFCLGYVKKISYTKPGDEEKLEGLKFEVEVSDQQTKKVFLCLEDFDDTRLYPHFRTMYMAKKKAQRTAAFASGIIHRIHAAVFRSFYCYFVSCWTTSKL